MIVTSVKKPIGNGLKKFGLPVKSIGGGDAGTSVSTSPGPGPQELIAGDSEAGFYGEVTATELYKGTELALEIGLSTGTAISVWDEAGWLKFAFKGKILFIAKKPFRYSNTWDELYELGCVYGTDDTGVTPTATPTNQRTTVVRGDNTFIVRLPKGGPADPTDGTMLIDSEWNQLMVRVWETVSAEQLTPNWANYTHTELGVDSNGSDWCQETWADNATRRVRRAGNGLLDHITYTLSYQVHTSIRWRPVLELV